MASFASLTNARQAQAFSISVFNFPAFDCLIQNWANFAGLGAYRTHVWITPFVLSVESRWIMLIFWRSRCNYFAVSTWSDHPTVFRLVIWDRLVLFLMRRSTLLKIRILAFCVCTLLSKILNLLKANSRLQSTKEDGYFKHLANTPAKLDFRRKTVVLAMVGFLSVLVVWWSCANHVFS